MRWLNGRYVQRSWNLKNPPELGRVFSAAGRMATGSGSTLIMLHREHGPELSHFEPFMGQSSCGVRGLPRKPHCSNSHTIPRCGQRLYETGLARVAASRFRPLPYPKACLESSRYEGQLSDNTSCDYLRPSRGHVVARE